MLIKDSDDKEVQVMLQATLKTIKKVNKDFYKECITLVCSPCQAKQVGL